MPVEKRGAEGDDAGPDPKRTRTKNGGADGSNGAAAVSTAPLDAIQKAKKVLELQKKLQEKLKSLPQVWGAVCGGRAAERIGAWATMHCQWEGGPCWAWPVPAQGAHRLLL